MAGRRILRWGTALCLMVASLPGLLGQSGVYGLGTPSSVGVEGTSTLHDWEMTASRFTGFFRLSEEGSEVLIQDLIFEAAVEGLSAEKAKMERDAKKALEADRYPLIRFEQAEALRIGSGPVYQKQADMLLAGRLIIKGVRRFSKLPVSLAKRDDGILITGAVTLDMTDFGLSPPRAMLGMIKTGKEIVVRYELWWVPE